MATRKGAVAKHSPSHSSAVPAPSEMGPLAQRSAVKASLIEKDSLRPEGDVSKRQREDGWHRVSDDGRSCATAPFLFIMENDKINVSQLKLLL